MYIMGALAQLQLGPDALNLAGGRHGAVRIATALRRDMAKSESKRIESQNNWLWELIILELFDIYEILVDVTGKITDSGYEN